MIDNITLMKIIRKKPHGATHYSLLSEQYLRKISGGFERYDDSLLNPWISSKIKDENLAKLVQV